MANLPYSTRTILWIASSKDDLSAFPAAARSVLGFALHKVQNGATPDSAKPLPQLGSGVFELRAEKSGDAYRVVYVVKLESGVYVLDAFMKKSKTGKAIPQEIRRRIEGRLAYARKMDQESKA